MSTNVLERHEEEGHALMTVSELAVYLAVNERTVYRLVKEGRLPAYRVGGQWRFKLAVIDAWMRDEGLQQKRVV